MHEHATAAGLIRTADRHPVRVPLPGFVEGEEFKLELTSFIMGTRNGKMVPTSQKSRRARTRDREVSIPPW